MNIDDQIKNISALVVFYERRKDKDISGDLNDTLKLLSLLEKLLAMSEKDKKKTNMLKFEELMNLESFGAAP